MTSADDIVLVAAARTPQGRMSGQFASLPATSLGSRAIAGALERGGIVPSDVDAVIFGQVLAAGAGQNAARQAAIGAGLGVMAAPLGQQGVPVGSDRRDRRGPDDPDRGCDNGGRRRHGVDDPRTPPARRSRGAATSTARSRCSTTWPTTGSPTPSTEQSDGRTLGDRERRQRPASFTREQQDDVRSTLAPARCSSTRIGTARRGDLPVSCSPQGRRSSIEPTKGIRAETTTESLGQAASRPSPQGRHDHSGQCVADLRRRRGRSRRHACPRRGEELATSSRHSARTARPQAPTTRCRPSPPRRSHAPSTSRASRRDTSTSSRSTRRSALSWPSSTASSGLATTRSTRTAAASHSATPSALRAPACRHCRARTRRPRRRHRGRRRSAAEAVRATRSS